MKCSLHKIGGRRVGCKYLKRAAENVKRFQHCHHCSANRLVHGGKKGCASLPALFRINSDESQRPPEVTKKSKELRFKTSDHMADLGPRRPLLCNDASSWRKKRRRPKGARTSASAR